MNKTAIEQQLGEVRDSADFYRILRIGAVTIALLSLFTAATAINELDSAFGVYSVIGGVFLFVMGVTIFVMTTWKFHPKTRRIVGIESALTAELEELNRMEETERDEYQRKQARARELERRERMSKKLTANPPHSRADGLEYVYIIQDIDVTNFYKIGRTSSPYRRFGDFTAKFPFRFKIAMLFVVPDSDRTEKGLHRLFAEKRRNGEWFALDETDLEWLYSFAQIYAPAPTEGG